MQNSHVKRYRWSQVPHRNALALASAIALLGMPGTVFAQAASIEDFAVQRFESAPGPNNLLSAERVRMSEPFGWSAGVLFNYAREPFVVVTCVANENCDEAGAQEIAEVPVVRDMMQFDLLGSVNLASWIQLGLRVPLVYVSGDGFDASKGTAAIGGLSTFGLGDTMLEGKFRFFGDAKSTVALGGAVDIAAPLGQATADGAFIGNSPLTVGWRGIADFYVDGFYATVNLRGVYRGDADLGTASIGPMEFRYSAGAGYEITPIIKVQAEAFGSTQFSGLKGTNTLEADAAVVITPVDSGFAFTVGGGPGILDGVGVPLARVIAGASFTMESGDSDGDGISDNSDSCPTRKEDRDGFEDQDGCPDDDNDKDTIADGADKCPDKPEKINGWEDEDGCPDEVVDSDKDGIPDVRDKCPSDPGKVRNEAFYGCADSDEDGIPDPKDKCPNAAEDTDGFDDIDGCPDPDNDQDTIPDASDECGEEPEILNGFNDTDGCPDSIPDADKDGIPDNVDKCPSVAETFNGVTDDDGCPEFGKSLVEIGKDEVKILQRVEFETGSDKIQGKASFTVLDAVAGALRANPQIFLIEIAGHTDNVGDAKQNLDLSQKRAEAVKAYVVSRGVGENRLKAVGYGQERPLFDNANALNRTKNRRVEFKVLHSTEVKAPAPPPAPAPTPPAAPEAPPAPTPPATPTP